MVVPFPDRLLFGNTYEAAATSALFIYKQPGWHSWIRDQQWTGLRVGQLPRSPWRCSQEGGSDRAWFQNRERAKGQPDPICCPRGCGISYILTLL